MVVLVCVELGEQRSPQIVGGESLLEWLLHEEQLFNCSFFLKAEGKRSCLFVMGLHRLSITRCFIRTFRRLGSEAVFLSGKSESHLGFVASKLY